MIPIGAIQFDVRPGLPRESNYWVLIGRLELGQAIQFTRDEAKRFPGGKKAFMVFKRNEIRRAMWRRVTHDALVQLHESRIMVRQHAYATSPEDYRHIEAAFELLRQHLEYNPEKMDEKTLEGMFPKPTNPGKGE